MQTSSLQSGLTPQRQRLISLRLLLETCLLFLGLALLANLLGPRAQGSPPVLVGYLAVLLAQGLLLQRIYIVAHEAAHRKLDPLPWLNDLLGQAVLSPILVPLQVYRKIHQFHHGFNRKDVHTSALDVFVSPWPLTPLVRAFFYGLWFLGVFAGGLFLHSLVSIILFLCLPVPMAQKISPAFRNWSGRDRLLAWAQFLSAAAVHLLVYRGLGFSVWLFSLGLPLLSFAWVWSLLIYVFHYNTSLGAQVRYNARAIPANRLFRWWLMNFNQHATHHMYPNIPWHELPARAQSLPAAFAEKNQTATSLWQAVLNQAKGPTVVYKDDSNPAPQLFVHWED